MMQVASMTKRTPSGGFFKAFTSTMSALLRFLRLSRAASRAGRALARSASASSLIALAVAACSFASASCSVTTFLVSSASFLSFVITIIISSTSFWVFTNTGCSSLRSSFIFSTSLVVLFNLSRPTESLVLTVPSSSFFSPKTFRKVPSSSR